MNHEHEGFFIIECIFYLLLSSILLYVIMHTATGSMVFFRQQGSDSKSLSQWASAHDIFMRDIWQAPAQETEWKKISDTELIWHTHAGDRGWSFEKNALYRSVGIYNNQEGKWIKRSKNLTARAVARVTFNIIKQYHALLGLSCIKAVEYCIVLQMKGNQKTWQGLVCLKNRIGV